MKMLGIKDIEEKLEKLRDLYDKSDSNPRLQVKLQHEITKLVYQLSLWDDMYKAIGDERPTFINK